MFGLPCWPNMNIFWRVKVNFRVSVERVADIIVSFLFNWECNLNRETRICWLWSSIITFDAWSQWLDPVTFNLDNSVFPSHTLPLTLSRPYRLVDLTKWYYELWNQVKHKAPQILLLVILLTGITSLFWKVHNPRYYDFAGLTAFTDFR